jgi:hypothetical protein
MSGLREKTLLAIAEVHSGNGAEGERIADAALAAFRQWMDADGLVCVPREATAIMCLHASLVEVDDIQLTASEYRDAWRAMIAAAPDPLGDGP